jgi:hypothetical protein
MRETLAAIASLTKTLNVADEKFKRLEEDTRELRKENAEIRKEVAALAAKDGGGGGQGGADGSYSPLGDGPIAEGKRATAPEISPLGGRRRITPVAVGFIARYRRMGAGCVRPRLSPGPSRTFPPARVRLRVAAP